MKTKDERGRDIEKRIVLSMEYSVIRNLMAGNDAQCFTTQQYAAGRESWIEKYAGITSKDLGLDPYDKYSIETARKQLRSLPNVVVEVSPDVWTMKEVGDETVH